MRNLRCQRSYAERFGRESVTLPIAADADAGARVANEPEGKPRNFGAPGHHAVAERRHASKAASLT